MALIAGVAVCLGCAEELPDDVRGYRDRCLAMQDRVIPPTADDPHDGFKRVWVCDVEPGELVDPEGRPRFPYPDGTLVVKESQKQGQDYIWLVATARKREGAWQWDEYTRNFGDEPLLRLPIAQGVCRGCHRDAEGTDWIFTVFSPP